MTTQLESEEQEAQVGQVLMAQIDSSRREYKQFE
jgi:hypothetical protein